MAEIFVKLDVDGDRLETVRKAEERVALASKELREASIDLQEALLNLGHGLRVGNVEGSGVDFHDDETLAKVHTVLHELGVHDTTGVISAFQNAGILFRERR